MRDILVWDGENYIECELDGSKLTYACSEEPTYHIEVMLCDPSLYGELKRDVIEVFRAAGYDRVLEYLQTEECHSRYFIEGSARGYHDARSEAEMEEYLREATDKVWLMRSCHIPSRTPKYEAGRPAMERIFDTYDDIPRDGYGTWECGYWNGIMGALRWVFGDDKDFLDT